MVVGMLRDVVAVAAHGVSPFELGVVCEVFGIDRTDSGLPGYDFAVAAAEPAPLRTPSGFSIATPYGLDRAATADLVVIPAWRDPDEAPPPELLDTVRAAYARGARVMSVCSGAFVLAAAGLLDGRRAATHWRDAAALAERYPLVEVDANVLYVDDDPILTSAGSAAGIDLCLHIVRKEHGASVANAVARRMVVPPHRDGGQAQFVDLPMPEPDGSDGLAEVLGWMLEHVAEDLSVEQLAHRAMTSPRTFARRFRSITGTTPHQWILSQRVLLAQRLLETTDEPIEIVAQRCGFGSAGALRQHFTRVISASPQAYRRTFRSEPA